MAQATEDRASRIVRGPFEGVYGPWNLTQGEVDGVVQYRGALMASAVCTAAGVFAALAGVDVPLMYDGLYAAHTAAFGLALVRIHIYVKPLHDLLKVLWGAGLLGAVALVAGGAAQPGLVVSVVDHPALLLAVGWQFVALTGLYFKEFACFGRLEAVGLMVLLPAITGGHFLGALQGGVMRFALIAFAAEYLYFALNKFKQLPEADIGDLSVFQHMTKVRQQERQQ